MTKIIYFRVSAVRWHYLDWIPYYLHERCDRRDYWGIELSDKGSCPTQCYQRTGNLGVIVELNFDWLFRFCLKGRSVMSTNWKDCYLKESKMKSNASRSMINATVLISMAELPCWPHLKWSLICTLTSKWAVSQYGFISKEVMIIRSSLKLVRRLANHLRKTLLGSHSREEASRYYCLY